MPYKTNDQALIAIAMDSLKRKNPKKHAEVETKVAAGAVVEMECSSFTDPGDDYTKLLVDGECVAHQGGF